jgi:hypothetical protein
MEEKEKSFWCIITAPVLYCKEISDKSKILYGVISNLTKQKGYCYAHNATLAEELGWGERTVQDCIKQLIDAGFVSREIEYKDKQVSVRKIRVITTPDPGSTLHEVPAAACTHNIVTNEVIKKRTPSRKKTTDPFLEQAVLEGELDARTRWNRITSLWITSESEATLAGTFKNHFLPLGKEVQMSIVEMVEAFGSDVEYLEKVWISTAFKNKCMNTQSLKKDIEKAKRFSKPKSKTDDIRRISNF